MRVVAIKTHCPPLLILTPGGWLEADLLIDFFNHGDKVIATLEKNPFYEHPYVVLRKVKT